MSTLANHDPVRYRAIEREPYALTLFCYAQRQEQERIDRVLGRLEAVDDAGLMAVGFHEPNKLTRARQQIIADAAPPVPEDQKLDRIKELADRMAARDRAREVPA